MQESTSNYKMKPINPGKQRRVNLTLKPEPSLESTKHMPMPNNVHLSRLSPKNMKLIRKPLLKRSTKIQSPQGQVSPNFRRPKLSTTDIDEAEAMEQMLQSMKPTLD